MGAPHLLLLRLRGLWVRGFSLLGRRAREWWTAVSVPDRHVRLSLCTIKPCCDKKSHRVSQAGLLSWSVHSRVAPDALLTSKGGRRVGIFITYLRFHQGTKAQGINRNIFPYVAPLQPYGCELSRDRFCKTRLMRSASQRGLGWAPRFVVGLPSFSTDAHH